MNVPLRWMLLVVAFGSCSAVGQEVKETGWSPAGSSVAKELTAVNTRLTQAYENERVDVLRKMLDDAHVHNNVFGKALTKEAFLHDIESGILEFKSYTTPAIQWHVDGSTAIATGIIEAQAVRDGRPVPANRFLFTRVFVKRKKDWKVLLFHNTMMPNVQPGE